MDFQDSSEFGPDSEPLQALETRKVKPSQLLRPSCKPSKRSVLALRSWASSKTMTPCAAGCRSQVSRVVYTVSQGFGDSEPFWVTSSYISFQQAYSTPKAPKKVHLKLGNWASAECQKFWAVGSQKISKMRKYCFFSRLWWFWGASFGFKTMFVPKSEWSLQFPNTSLPIIDNHRNIVPPYIIIAHDLLMTIHSH